MQESRWAVCRPALSPSGFFVCPASEGHIHWAALFPSLLEAWPGIPTSCCGLHCPHPPRHSHPPPGLRVFWVELLHDSLGSNAAHKPDRWILGEPVPPLWPCGPSWRNVPHRDKDMASWAPRLRLPFWKGHGVLFKMCYSCRIASPVF